MAATDAGAAATERHRRAVLALRAETVAQIVRSWPLIDLRDIDRSSVRWYRLASAIVRAGRERAASEAADYIAEFATAETGLAVAAAELRPIDSRVLEARLYGAGPLTLKQKVGQGLPPSRARTATLSRLAGEVTRTVVEGSREVVLDTAEQNAFRWQRITDGNPCAFCALLASRGAVYRTAASSRFQAHRGCACTAELVMRNAGFRTDESKQWAELYDRSLREYRADPNAAVNSDPLNIFRRAYEAQRS